LRVVVVLLLARRASLAGSSAREVDTTALVVLLHTAGCATGRSRLGDSDEGGWLRGNSGGRLRGNSGGGRGRSGRHCSWLGDDGSSGLGRGRRSRDSRGTASAGALKESRARNRVRSRSIVDVEQHALVVGLVRGPEVDARRESDGAGRCDGDLAAAVVELGFACGVGLVEGDDLRADEIVAFGEVGDRDVDYTAILVELVDGPYCAGQAVLVDLHPAALALGGCGCDVDHDRAVVGLQRR